MKRTRKNGELAIDFPLFLMNIIEFIDFSTQAS